MKKSTFTAILGCAAVMCALSTSGFAQNDKSGSCHKGLDDKLMWKIHFALDNEEELNITAEQRQDLRELKKTLKKTID